MSKDEKILLCVESPAKARTMEKILPSNYTVRATYGHIMDLPKSKMGIDIENDFEPNYSVTKDKNNIVRELKSLAKNSDKVIILSDDDREGEVIAWTLAKVLNLKPDNDRSVVHEITEVAILKALDNPRTIDMKSVNAGIARRVLDRLVGYNLSPILWRKIKFGLSAGRVASPTLRLTVDREKEILAFNPEEYWKLKLTINEYPDMVLELNKKNGKKYTIRNKIDADNIKKYILNTGIKLIDIVDITTNTKPRQPFTTSTLQQTGNSKLGISIKQVMSLAQKLYEGNYNIPDHTGGLITYMRTDNSDLTSDTLKHIDGVITKYFGGDYLVTGIGNFKSKNRTQDAHSGIQPVDINIHPNTIKQYLPEYDYKLYSLIWARTVAFKMKPSISATTTYIFNTLSAPNDNIYELITKGKVIKYRGYLKAYEI